MDLLKLVGINVFTKITFALLVAVATVRISAEGPKKKIRIHLPQKVKHIHHHKKIYITNHPAASQYAPAYMPSAEGAMAVPTSIALPAVASLLPVNSAEMYDEPQQRAPGHVPAGSKLLPLYRARGYYGPNPTEWEDQEYDLSPPPEPSDHSYVPTAFSGSSAVAAPLSNYPQKKVKIVKLNESPRKKAVRKGKPKRGKPQLDEEIPVSTFHEQFYSDLDGSATLRKVKKPQRVEKIIDGDTEHIHTYSEEHIHKLVYGDGTTKLIGVDPVGSMSALSASHPMYPIRNSLLALSPGTLNGFAAIGSMGTPSHLEYAAYNPRDVTHDHVFHDHGEIPSDADVSKENLPFPPRISYNSHGVRIGGVGSKGLKSKYPTQPYLKPTRPSVVNDYSYYENMYSPYSRPRQLRPTNPSSLYAATTESAIDDYRPVPSFKLRDNEKTRNAIPSLSGLHFGSKHAPDYLTQQTSVPAPFAVSSTIVHDYKPKSYATQTGNFGFNKYIDPLKKFKDNSYTNNFNFDSYASASSNLYTSDDKYDPSHIYQGKKGKKKSISTQNIRIGGLDHQTMVDHIGDSGMSMSLNSGAPTAMDFGQSKLIDSATSTPYTIRETSMMYPYYSAMASKALQDDQMQVAESSNTNYQYVEAPSPSTTEFTQVATTSIPPSSNYFEQEGTETIPTEITESTEYIVETRPKHRSKDTKLNSSSVLKDTRQRYSVLDLEEKDYKSADRPVAPPHVLHHGARLSYSHGTESPSETKGSRKYGDKI